MDISRSAVRDALSILEREGFIGRKKGIGTTINRHVLAVRTRLDLEFEFFSLIRRSGKTPKAEYTEVFSVKASEEIAEKLAVNPGDILYRVDRVVSADTVPAVFCRDYICTSLIRRNNIPEETLIEELKNPIFRFLCERCGESVDMDVSEIHALSADEELSKMLKVQKGTPLLHLKETGYNFNGASVVYAEEYYPEGPLTHIIVRKHIGSSDK